MLVFYLFIPIEIMLLLLYLAFYFMELETPVLHQLLAGVIHGE